MACESLVPPALRAGGTAGMSFAPSADSLGAERLANQWLDGSATPIFAAVHEPLFTIGGRGFLPNPPKRYIPGSAA
jgi:hypothetical protein